MPIYTPENTCGDNVVVTVDGKRVDDCAYADTDRGIAECFARPLTDDGCGNLRMIRHVGKVAVELGEGGIHVD